jgi:hypothetical protein
MSGIRRSDTAASFTLGMPTGEGMDLSQRQNVGQPDGRASMVARTTKIPHFIVERESQLSLQVTPLAEEHHFWGLIKEMFPRAACSMS